MSNDNPYAPPQVDVSPPQIIGRAPPNELTPPGVWRCDGYIVMHKGAKLPYLCVYDGEPAINRTKTTLLKESGGNSFAFLLGQYGGAAYEMGVKKEHFYLELPTGAGESARWWIILGIQAALLVVGIALILVPALVAEPAIRGIAVIIGLICLLAMSVLGPIFMRRLTLAHNDLYYAWIGGAGTVFLNSLATWPYQRPRGV